MTHGPSRKWGLKRSMAAPTEGGGSMKEKRCSRCGETKPLDEFHRNPAQKDGHDGYCADCRCAYVHKRFVSLDYAILDGGKTLHDRLAARRMPHDETYPRVFAALAYWIREKIITKNEAAAIYMHAVEGFSFESIGVMADRSTGTVYQAYQRGVVKLRRLYDDQAEAVAV